MRSLSVSSCGVATTSFLIFSDFSASTSPVMPAATGTPNWAVSFLPISISLPWPSLVNSGEPPMMIESHLLSTKSAAASSMRCSWRTKSASTNWRIVPVLFRIMKPVGSI